MRIRYWVLLIGLFVKYDVLARCANSITVSEEHYTKLLNSWRQCGLERETIIRDLFRLGDRNQDGCLIVAECEEVFLENLYENEVMSGRACMAIKEKCDCDGDEIVTLEEALQADHSCIAHCNEGHLVWLQLEKKIVNETRPLSLHLVVPGILIIGLAVLLYIRQYRIKKGDHANL
jgi:hypothetical protein